MKNNFFNHFLLTSYLISMLLIVSCGGGSGGTPANPCVGVTITVTGTITNASAVGMSNGSIVASASGGSGFTFSFNGGAFQASGNFTGLAAGTYTIAAKNSSGCTGSQSFTVNNNDPCASVSFTVGGTVVTATPCVNPANGSITVTTTGGGSGFTYNINGGAFQASATFTSLAVNTYTMGAKESGGCLKTANVTVSATPPGTLFSAVRAIISNNCTAGGCHSGAAPAGGIDFTIDCNIVANKARIKVRAVDNFGTPQQMPPPPNPGLSLADRTAIVNWINAGGLYSN
ncbi:MAG: hypothetical protein EPO57_01575 [Chitinophagaceae bacterium]|nr:MAG: hypothetical protein EPO57_01575 [Chitinophagaceae bacterium]